MAGEFRVAKHCIDDALETADAESSMTREGMGRALLTELLGQMRQHHSAQELTDLVNYQLENLGEDSFVVTRGC
ncbi:hypothetical protein HBA55_35505 [Pseudomaricurvus alkylphenolicus]|jgi:hypothetical protein|uniref:hypothetical protein n=1 Tax=Pseudomaricurvus alkylphenolicus TaxID=1306991 RepID=UPI001422A83F|nr:hypothetical protein [Pseudomaricurvus alkylphenolicus]NIB44940.1 hypothetical protein [Pseudomaricurvus alkylphenolicus]